MVVVLVVVCVSRMDSVAAVRSVDDCPGLTAGLVDYPLAELDDVDLNVTELAMVLSSSVLAVKAWLTKPENSAPFVESGVNAQEHVLRLSWSFVIEWTSLKDGLSNLPTLVNRVQWGGRRIGGEYMGDKRPVARTAQSELVDTAEVAGSGQLHRVATSAVPRTGRRVLAIEGAASARPVIECAASKARTGAGLWIVWRYPAKLQPVAFLFRDGSLCKLDSAPSPKTGVGFGDLLRVWFEPLKGEIAPLRFQRGQTVGRCENIPKRRVEALDRLAIARAAHRIIRPVIERAGSKIRTGARLWIVGVDTAKAQLFARRSRGGSFWLSSDLPRVWREQVASERAVLRYRKGQPMCSFARIPGQRAEASDCMVYAMAARQIIRPDWEARAMALVTPDAPEKVGGPVLKSEWMQR